MCSRCELVRWRFDFIRVVGTSHGVDGLPDDLNLNLLRQRTGKHLKFWRLNNATLSLDKPFHLQAKQRIAVPSLQARHTSTSRGIVNCDTYTPFAQVVSTLSRFMWPLHMIASDRLKRQAKHSQPVLAKYQVSTRHLTELRLVMVIVEPLSRIL